MQIRLEANGRSADLVIDIHDPATSVADLLDALEEPARPIAIDGRAADPGERLDRVGLGDGSVIALGPDRLHRLRRSLVPDRSVDLPDGALTLTVASGFDVGRQVPVPPGRWVIGRADRRWQGGPPVLLAIDDPRLAAAHGGLRVDPSGHGRACGLGGSLSLVGAASEGAGAPVGRLRRLARRLDRGFRGDRQSPATCSPVAAASRITSRALPGWSPSSAEERTSCPGRLLLALTSSDPFPHPDPAEELPIGPGTHLALGPVQLTCDAPTEPAAVAPPAPGAATRPLHRRPRAPAAPDPELVALPAPSSPPPAVTPVGVLGVVASIAMGAAMVVLLHSWAYAAFALLGPVLLVANAMDSRRRRRRSTRSGTRQRQRDLRRLDSDLVAAADQERRRRQRLHPGSVGLLDRCTGTSPSCWERRATDADGFVVRLGTGVGPWSPPVRSAPDGPPDDVAAVLDQHRTIADVTIGCRLDPATPIAIVGPRPAALALARSIVLQASVDHGPVDLGVAVLAATGNVDAWRWATWLPHTRRSDGDATLAGHPAAADAVAARLIASTSADANRRVLVVIDDPAGLAARRSGSRALLRAAADPERNLVPLVLVADAVDVPAVCAMVLTVDDGGSLDGPPWVVAGPVELVGVGRTTAAEVARHLARLDDPELDDPGAALPAGVGLAPLLPADPYDPDTLAEGWRRAGTDPAPVATLGRADDGPLVVDLVADGPHVLVAGTTGSGKSELLRTLVTSLALASSPEHLTFVLVDFKGGSAFDACARLPHTTGIVTDLDDHLAARALRCLEAELRHRERRLREVAAADLTAFRSLRPGGDPLPRLVVVVDEFATLAAELPDFVDALVGIAQRGRSLGVHLVLATQRPAGAVSDHIRANTGLRIALRVQDDADSRDVIDSPAAASLPRQRPGRALARLGPGELVAFQAARVTGTTTGVGPVTISEPAFGPPEVEPVAPAAAPSPGAPAATDLSRLVDAAAKAWAQLGGAPPRRPWPEALPEVVQCSPARGPAGRPGEVVLGLADDPDHQRHVPFTWDLDAGPLLAVGIPGSGTTTLAATAVLAATHRWTADDLHVHVIDLGSGALRPLLGLAPVGAVVAGEDHERQRRLVAELAADLAERRADPRSGERARRLLVLDGLAAFHSTWDDIEPTGTWAHLLVLLSHGPSVGIAVLLTATASHGVPHPVLAACHQRLVFRLADRADHAAFGISPAAVPSLPPGRALVPDGVQLVQVIWPGPDLAAAVHAAAEAQPLPVRRPPMAVDVLPDVLTWSALPDDVWHIDADGTLALAVGLADAGLTPAWVELAPGGHALVVGPSRSGRTTALRALAAAARQVPALEVLVLTPSPASWLDHPGPVLRPGDPEAAAAVASLDDSAAHTLVLVDDADRTTDDHPLLALLVRERRATRHVVAAARADRLRGAYAHWLREVQADRTGLLLHPDLDLDGDLLGIRLPRRPPLPLRAGRGWLTGPGPAQLVQVVREGG